MCVGGREESRGGGGEVIEGRRTCVQNSGDYKK